MTAIDDFVANAHRYAAGFYMGGLPLRPARAAAVVACMDARINLYSLLGIAEGQVHLIRNAGGVVTADTRRSLAISQRLLGTTEIMLIHHTDCGMLTFSDEEFREQIRRETGIRPDWSSETFRDLDDDVRQSIARIRNDPAIPSRKLVRGFVYNVKMGTLAEVKP